MSRIYHVKSDDLRPKSVLLTGASGALGRALALHHAHPNCKLHLWGRNTEKLSETVTAAEKAGATVSQRAFDLSDGKASVEAVLKDDEVARFDLAYMVAGIGDIRSNGDIADDPALVLRAAQVNFAAPAAMAAALAARMAERGGGRIVLIGSAAGHHSLPFAASYSGSKAGLARFSDALRIAAKPHGVTVTLAAPGFIRTPAAQAKSGNRPFEISLEKAAQRIARAGEQGRRHYVTPWPFAIMQKVDSLLPGNLRDVILSRLTP